MARPDQMDWITGPSCMECWRLLVSEQDVSAPRHEKVIIAHRDADESGTAR